MRHDVKGQFVIYGRNQSKIKSESGAIFDVKPFDIEAIVKQEFRIFAPFAFSTRDKVNPSNYSDYIDSNKRLIADAVKVIRGGNIGSVINLSSGVVTMKSESQAQDISYSVYAELKSFQEDEYAEACSSVGIPFINCRVFSLSGTDMPEPRKYVIGHLVEQAVSNGKIELHSKNTVTRRHMDSRDMMFLLLKCVESGSSMNLESSGDTKNLIDLARMILKEYKLPEDRIIFKSKQLLPTNNYFSDKNDFEDLAAKNKYSLIGLGEQIKNVQLALEKTRVI
jgi:nucleoside-diphosphate-sugar epimerase